MKKLLIEKYQEKHAELLSDYQHNENKMSPLELSEIRSRMADILEIIEDLKNYNPLTETPWVLL